MKEKRTYGSSTYRLKDENGEDCGFIHIDRFILPIVVPGRLGAVPPLESHEDQDEKMPTAEAGRKKKVMP